MKHFPFIENDRNIFHVELFLTKDIICKGDNNENIKYCDVGVMEYNHITKEKKVLGVTRQYYSLDSEYLNHSSFTFFDEFKDKCLKGLDIAIESHKHSFDRNWYETDIIIEEPQQ